MDDIRAQILEGLSDGKSLRAICREPGMPNVSTVIRWLADDDEAEFRAQYVRAREAGDDAMAEDIQDIADDKNREPQDRKVAIDARKWLLAKRQPKKYGDKTLVGSDPENPLPAGFSVNLVKRDEAG